MKTTIILHPKHRAAYESLRLEVPGLTLSDFVSEAITFWLMFKDEASFRPMVRHLAELREQLKTIAQPAPPIDQQHFAQLVAKQVMEQLTAAIPPPPPEVTGWRGWLIRRWQARDIARPRQGPVISTYRQ